MTYLLFLGVFLVAPLLALVLWGGRPSRRELLAVGVVSALALLYTTPWDDLIIRLGVWAYPPGRVLGLLVGRVPLEECLFYVLQVALVAAVTRLAWGAFPEGGDS